METLRLLDGIVDIYLPDMRYSDNAAAMKYSIAPDYPEINRAAIKEMYRQVGNLVLDENGVRKAGFDHHDILSCPATLRGPKR